MRIVNSTANDGQVTKVAYSSDNPTGTSDADFSRLPSDLLTARSYTDSAANFIAPADTNDATYSVKYEYRVRAVDSDDQEGSWSAVKSVTIPRASAVLPAPAGLNGFGDKQQQSQCYVDERPRRRPL